MQPTKLLGLNITEIAAILTVIISWTTFSYILFKDFLIPGKISVGINQIIALRPPTNNRAMVAQAIVEGDFLSSNKSDWVRMLISRNPDLPRLLQSGQKEQFHKTIQSICSQQKISPFFRQDLIIELSKQTGFGTSFGIPINIVNSGLHPVYVSQIALIFKNRQTSDRFFYDGLIVMNEDAVYRPSPAIRDVDRIQKTFNGTWVPSNGVFNILMQFVLRIQEDNIVYAKTNILSAQYEYNIEGYGIKGDKIFESKTYELKIEDRIFLDTFSGGDIAINTVKRNQ